MASRTAPSAFSPAVSTSSRTCAPKCAKSSPRRAPRCSPQPSWSSSPSSHLPGFSGWSMPSLITELSTSITGSARCSKQDPGGVEFLRAEETQNATPDVAEGAPQPQLEPPANERFRWYIIHAYSGFERKVKESIEGRVQAFGLQNRIGRVMIPTEPVTEVFNGKKRTVERVFLPGYVLAEMDLENDLWPVIQNTPRVTGFLGTGDKPVSLTEAEVSSILFRSDVSKDKPRLKVKFQKNESVRITEGPFANFNGVVDDVNEDRETLKVMVTIFGRSTPVELDFGKVEKIA